MIPFLENRKKPNTRVRNKEAAGWPLHVMSENVQYSQLQSRTRTDGQESDAGDRG
jgi:hypothetical protein